MKKQLKPNKELILKSAILNKQLAYSKYKKIQIDILQNTHISSVDGGYIFLFDSAEMRMKLKEAETEFANASTALNKLLLEMEDE